MCHQMLSEQQRKLTEDNTKLINWAVKNFPHKMELEEAAAVCSLALCEAAVSYQPGAAEFSTYALVCMRNSLQGKKAHPQFLPLNQAKEEVEREHDQSDLYIREIIQDLDTKRRRIIEMILDGKNQADIAREFGVTRSRVTQILQEMRPYFSKKLGVPFDESD